MTDFALHTNPVNIEDEMKRSYMDYAMSVIVGRALPDARDGLKPAHRRVLYGMKTMALPFAEGRVKGSRSSRMPWARAAAAASSGLAPGASRVYRFGQMARYPWTANFRVISLDPSSQPGP